MENKISIVILECGKYLWKLMTILLLSSKKIPRDKSIKIKINVKLMCYGMGLN